MRVKRGCDVLCPDASATSLHTRASSDVPHPDFARSGLGLHLGADPLDSKTAGTTVSLHRGIGWDGYLVADGHVPAHILRQVVTDADAVPVLLNGWVRFDGVYRIFGIGEPVIVRVRRCVHHDLVRAASFNGDIARSGSDIEADGSGDLQRAVEVTFGLDVTTGSGD